MDQIKERDLSLLTDRERHLLKMYENLEPSQYEEEVDRMLQDARNRTDPYRITFQNYDMYGCPHTINGTRCGGKKGYLQLQIGAERMIRCSACDHVYVIGFSSCVDAAGNRTAEYHGGGIVSPYKCPVCQHDHWIQFSGRDPTTDLAEFDIYRCARCRYLLDMPLHIHAPDTTPVKNEIKIYCLPNTIPAMIEDHADTQLRDHIRHCCVHIMMTRSLPKMQKFLREIYHRCHYYAKYADLRSQCLDAFLCTTPSGIHDIIRKMRVSLQ